MTQTVQMSGIQFQSNGRGTTYRKYFAVASGHNYCSRTNTPTTENNYENQANLKLSPPPPLIVLEHTPNLQKTSNQRSTHLPSKGGINSSSDTDQAAGHGVLQMILLGEKRLDARLDRPTLHFAGGVFCDDSRSNFDLIANLHS